MNYTKARTLKALRALPTAELYAIGAAQGYNPAPDGHWLPSCPKDAPVLARRKQVMIGSNSMDTTAAPPWEPPSYYASSFVFANTTIYAEYLAALVRANPLGFMLPLIPISRLLDRQHRGCMRCRWVRRM